MDRAPQPRDALPLVMQRGKVLKRQRIARMTASGGLAALLVFGGAMALRSPGTGTEAAGDTGSVCDIEEAKRIVYGTSDVEVGPEGEALICAKAAMITADEQAAKESEERRQEEGIKTTGEPEQPVLFEEGIWGEAEANEGPPSPNHYTSVYRGVFEGQDVLLAAGSNEKETSKGVVYFLMIEPESGKTVKSDTIDSPIEGPLEITSYEKKPLIQLVSKSNDQQIFFDLATGKFVTE